MRYLENQVEAHPSPPPLGKSRSWVIRFPSQRASSFRWASQRSSMVCISIAIVYFAFTQADDDGLSDNRIILCSVFHHCDDDILFERFYASISHKDTPGAIPDASGGHYGARTLYKARSFDQAPNPLSPIAPYRPLDPGSAGVHRSEGR